MLRRKSSKKEAKAAKPAASASAAVRRKAKPDIYTVFLAIALVAVLIGILFLYLELQAYDFKHSGGPPVAVRGDGVPPAWNAACGVCETPLAT